MSLPSIEINHLIKDFSVGLRDQKLRAVDDLSLQVHENEIFGLLGPNGSGKSTTLKILLGLLSPSQGACRIFGQPSADIAARRSVGFLPEAPYFYRYLTGRELVTFYAKLCGMPRAELKESVDRVIELVNLSDAANRRVGTYSKGMLQRIGMAQALVHDPRLIVLDEPTAGVDPLGAVAIGEIIRDLKKQGKTILICSHLLAQVEGLCDRVAIMHRGRLVLEGAVDALLSNPCQSGFLVEGLNTEGRSSVQSFVAEHGGYCYDQASGRRSLEALFLHAVGSPVAGEGSGQKEDEKQC